MITYVKTEEGDDSFGHYIRHIYRVGVAFGKVVLLKECFAFGQGRKFHNFLIQLEGDCVWTGTFRTARKAARFYRV